MPYSGLVWTTTIFTMSPLVVGPVLVAVDATMTPMNDGTVAGGLALLPPLLLVQPPEHAGGSAV